AVLRGDREAGGREDPLQDLGQRAAARPRALKRGTMMTTLYGLNNCDTCRKARKWLDRFGIAHGFVDYRDDKPGPDTLVEWAGKLGGFEAMVNKSSTTWRQLPDNRKAPGSDAEWKLLLREYPQLVRRPVVVTDDGVASQGFSDNGFKKRFGTGE